MSPCRLQPHTLAYGFDDGPNCSHNAFYDYLVEEGQKASECRISGMSQGLH